MISSITTAGRYLSSKTVKALAYVQKDEGTRLQLVVKNFKIGYPKMYDRIYTWEASVSMLSVRAKGQSEVLGKYS